MFQAAVTESLNSCFKIVLTQLRRNAFVPETNLSSHSSLRSLPLASLLPQVKAVASRLLPISAVQSDGLTAELKEISSGPLLDGLCISIFSSQDSDIWK